MNPERDRLHEDRTRKAPWKRWGPYLSERQWGTVREDYSPDGDAWNYFTHDQARSRAYRWGEDGLAGFSDDKQRMCFALALWNERDPILKERLFGLTNSEGNHGEDVKEYYYYLDSTPTHSYMKYLYKYPHAEFPYADLVQTNRSRGIGAHEYELIDTGVFADDRYFDVFVEFAKDSPEDILIRVTVHNRGPETASLHVLPTVWFRNYWTWQGDPDVPRMSLADRRPETQIVSAEHYKLGTRYLYCEPGAAVLFTENETNTARLFGLPNQSRYVKDGINDFVVHGNREAINPANTGTKCAADHRLTIAPGESETVRVRLSDVPPDALDRMHGDGPGPFGTRFDELIDIRLAEADDFYNAITPSRATDDQALVFRQALAGMLWSKQFYYYDVDRWLEERGSSAFAVPGTNPPRNDHWHHMYNAHIISMPDKWEYPWYAAWDLAFHVLALTLVDEDFGKNQLDLMLKEHYLHPNGQIPAYEWNFGDVNPPVHAWATIFTYRLDLARRGEGDLQWLEQNFQKLLLNFTWWVNRKDRSGRNVFEGGFLGLDNIGVFDRSAPLPTGGYLEQADGTAWMGLYCLNMLEIAVELGRSEPAYVDMSLKFTEHFLWIASAMAHAGDDTGMWDEEDGFFYDVLRKPDGTSERLKVRSIVGLLPLCAVAVFDRDVMANSPDLSERFKKFLEARPELVAFIHDPREASPEGRHLGAILKRDKLERVLTKMLDENEFLGPYGIRSLSRYHEKHPYVLHVGDEEFRVAYLPAESDTRMFGGNSNWRGPVWMPINALIIRGLLQYYVYYGDDLRVECPTGSGNYMNLYEVASEISHRLVSIFLRDSSGRRPVFGGQQTFQTDPHWRDHVLFYEYFHGDNGAGLGASHQTGWTGIVSRLLHVFGTLSPEDVYAAGKMGYFLKTEQARRQE